MEDNTPDNASVFRQVPRKVIYQSLLYQFLLALPLISFVLLISIGIYVEPGYGYLSDRSEIERITMIHFWLALFSSSSFFSCMGSFVSYLSRDRNLELEDDNKSFVLSFHVLGSIFGILLLLLFLGGFIDGNLFPSFGQEIGFISIYHNFNDIDDWAKLFVWTFIAGFSERLMPDLLNNIAKRFNKKPD